MGADYSFELISIETYAPQFIGHNKFFLGSVNDTSLFLSVIWSKAILLSLISGQPHCHKSLKFVIYCVAYRKAEVQENKEDFKIALASF